MFVLIVAECLTGNLKNGSDLLVAGWRNLKCRL